MCVFTVRGKRAIVAGSGRSERTDQYGAAELAKTTIPIG